MPFREEASPSFSYDAKRNLWFDHGTGVGGDNIELLVRLKDWDLKDAVAFGNEIPGRAGYDGEMVVVVMDIVI